jgi:DNA adenine methylase
VSGTAFLHAEYEEVMVTAKEGDLIYCDPPYSHSQSILYGAQDFSLAHMFDVIHYCKERGVAVAVSIDGNKRSGDLVCDIPLPRGLFEREILVTTGRSMLKRFQMRGGSLEAEVVTDRLLLTY